MEGRGREGQGWKWAAEMDWIFRDPRGTFHGEGDWMQVPRPLQPAGSGTFGGLELDRVIQSNSAWFVGILYSQGVELKHGALQGCASPSTPAQTRSLQWNATPACLAPLSLLSNLVGKLSANTSLVDEYT